MPGHAKTHGPARMAAKSPANPQVIAKTAPAPAAAKSLDVTVTPRLIAVPPLAKMACAPAKAASPVQAAARSSAEARSQDTKNLQYSVYYPPLPPQAVASRCGLGDWATPRHYYKDRRDEKTNQVSRADRRESACNVYRWFCCRTGRTGYAKFKNCMHERLSSPLLRRDARRRTYPCLSEQALRRS